MAGFIYYLPGSLPGDRRLANDADLVAAGAGYANAPGGWMCGRTSKGPDEGEGLILTANRDCVPAQFTPEQSWRKGPGGKFWVGLDPKFRPGPADLRRAEWYEGVAVKLLDGNEWIVPRCVAVVPGQRSTLPQLLDVAEDGETVIGRIHPRYKSLCEGAFAWWLKYSRQVESSEGLTGPQQVALAVEALAVNYRVGKLEVMALLQLWSTDEYGNVLRAMIDADAIDAHFDAKAAVEAGEKKAAG